jgi:hypothetical protein
VEAVLAAEAAGRTVGEALADQGVKARIARKHIAAAVLGEVVPLFSKLWFVPEKLAAQEELVAESEAEQKETAAAPGAFVLALAHARKYLVAFAEGSAGRGLFPGIVDRGG